MSEELGPAFVNVFRWEGPSQRELIWVKATAPSPSRLWRDRVGDRTVRAEASGRGRHGAGVSAPEAPRKEFRAGSMQRSLPGPSTDGPARSRSPKQGRVPPVPLLPPRLPRARPEAPVDGGASSAAANRGAGRDAAPPVAAAARGCLDSKRL